MSKTSTPSEDSDSDEDEEQRRKYISLKGGQCLLWSANKFGNDWDLTQDHTKYYDDVTPDEYNIGYDNKALNNSFKRNIDGRHSLKHFRAHTRPRFNLDNINLNNDFEYGFNPKRATGSKANNIVKLRPLSLYAPPSPKKSYLKPTNSDASADYGSQKNNFVKENHIVKNGTFLKRTVSYARNDYEAQLEKKVLSLRAQPSNLKFQGSKGKLNEQELAEDIANARRRRFVRRQLSFDSHHSTKRWKKTLSLDSGLATDSLWSYKSVASFKIKYDSSSKSEELLDSEVKGSENECSNERNCKSVEFLDIISMESPRDHLDANGMDTKCTSEASTLVRSSCETVVPLHPIKVFPPKPVEAEKAPEVDVLLLAAQEQTKTEKTKRRSSIPHILSAFRLPNKRTFQKFIRKKPQDNSPPVLSPTEVKDKKASSVQNTKALENGEVLNSNQNVSQHSVNTFEKAERAESEDLISTPLTDKSSSSYSLPRVDEDKESFEFSSPLERRSKSSCSISISKTTNQQRLNQEPTVLQRRMSDTVLSCNERSVGCSPGKKFVRRLLSPVVCGLPSPDKYGLLNDSMQSLASYDSSSIASDSDVSYPQLFDFGSQELVEEMTLIDKELLIRISWEELSVLGWMSPDKFVLAPNIMKMVQFFNRIAMLISTSVLIEETCYRRAKVIRKAIKLACRCRYAKNYNSLKAVLGGLQCTPIFRLKATWKQVPSRYRRLFRELSEIMSENNNFSIYRQEISTALRNPPCIPFLGNFLTQVAHTHAYMAVHVKYKRNHSFLENGSIRNKTEKKNRAKEDEGNSFKLGPIVHTTHTRSDSDDSGVVLNLNRLSHTSDDYDTSPRQVSPDDENRKFEDVFNNEPKKNSNNHPSSPSSLKKFLSDEFLQRKHDERELFRHSYSVDNEDLHVKQYNQISNIINNRPVQPDQTNDLYECELEFWKYQISAVQFNIIPRTYIRRFLMNSPYNTEEDNYKLSLKREPPAR